MKQSTKKFWVKALAVATGIYVYKIVGAGIFTKVVISSIVTSAVLENFKEQAKGTDEYPIKAETDGNIE